MTLPPRPEFEPESDAEKKPRGSALLAWLRLMRLPNVFTALTDVAMGFLFVRHRFDDAGRLVCLVAASALLYTAGMVLNDVFDFTVDARERPFRPLPSGRISLNAARLLGFVLLILGTSCGWLAGFLPTNEPSVVWRSGAVATALAACVLLYDGYLKQTPIGPLGMGACRFLNVLLGMSASAAAAGGLLGGYGAAELLAAAGIGVYIVGVTMFSRSEAETSSRPALLAAVCVMAGGVVLLASCATQVPVPSQRLFIYWLLLALLMFRVCARCSAAVANPEPSKVQAAVKLSILSLIWLDAATAVAVANRPLEGAAIAALLIPALLLGRWVYST